MLFYSLSEHFTRSTKPRTSIQLMATSSNIDFPAILSYETVRAYSHLYIRSNVCKFTIILKIVYRLRDIAILYVDSMETKFRVFVSSCCASRVVLVVVVVSSCPPLVDNNIFIDNKYNTNLINVQRRPTTIHV